MNDSLINILLKLTIADYNYYYNFLLGTKLPWTVKLDNGSVYTLNTTVHSMKHEPCDIIEPCSLSAMVAVTTKYQPPTSDNISSLALCVHSHTNLLVAKLADGQVT